MLKPPVKRIASRFPLSPELTIKISSETELNSARMDGFEPLADWGFLVDISLRRALQKENYLSKGRQAGNQKFYQDFWNFRYQRGLSFCDESRQPIPRYAAIHVSHILSKGAHPEMAYDLRNANLLLPHYHQQWETGSRKAMIIYTGNQKIIEALRSEYRK